MTIVNIAQALSRSQDFVKQAIKRFKQGELDKIKLTGNNRKLTQEQRKEIVEIIKTKYPKELSDFRFATQFWSTNILRQVIKKRYQIEYKIDKSYYNIFQQAGFSFHKPKTQDIRQDSEKIKTLLQERQKKIEGILPRLKSIYNLAPQKPKNRFYEGHEGIKTIFDEMTETLQSGETHYHCGPADDKLNQVLGLKTVDEIIKKRVNKGIKSRAITNKTPRTEKLAKQRLKGLREVKFLRSSSIPSRLHIFGPKIALMNLDKPLGIVIEDQAIADLMKMFFEGM